MLLPEDAFMGSLPKENRQRLIENTGDNSTLNYDIDKGTLNVMGDELTIQEVYFWQLPNGKKLVTTYYASGHDKLELMAYWYEKGTLKKDRNFYSFTNNTFSASDFFDTEKLSEELRAEIKNDVNSNVYYRVYLSDEQNLNVDVKFDTGFFEREGYENFGEDAYEKLTDAQHYLHFEYKDSKWKKNRLKDTEISNYE